MVNCHASALRSFEDVCRMLGMSQQAPNGWRQLCVKPHLLCIACFSSWASNFAAGSVLFGAGLPWLTPVVHPCFILATILSAACMIWIWRAGPQAARLPAFRLLTLAYLSAGLAMLVTPFVMRDCIPFSRPSVAVLGASFYIWSSTMIAAFGANAADHPHQPHKSLWPPLVASAFATMRVADIVTDVGVVRILMTQVSPPLAGAVVCPAQAAAKILAASDRHKHQRSATACNAEPPGSSSHDMEVAGQADGLFHGFQ